MKNTTVRLSISSKRIVDLLVGAFEGGSNYWISRIRGWEGNTDYVLLAEGKKDVTICLLDEDGILGKTEFILDYKAIKRGIRAMAKTEPEHFGDFMKESDDSTTADVFLQCCLFGEVIFG